MNKTDWIVRLLLTTRACFKAPEFSSCIHSLFLKRTNDLPIQPPISTDPNPDLAEMSLLFQCLIRLFGLAHPKDPLIQDRLDIMRLNEATHVVELLPGAKEQASRGAAPPKTIQ